MKNMNGYIKYILLLLFAASLTLTERISAQEKKTVEGYVSYITANNIYIKFESTDGIKDGDTLFIRQGNSLVPVLKVARHSSITCLCTYTGDLSVKISDKIDAKVSSRQEQKENNQTPISNPEPDINEQVLKAGTSGQNNIKYKQDIDGRLSVSSYSNLHNKSAQNNNRLRYTLVFNVNHISDSKLSLESYISFSHLLNRWDVVRQDVFNALKIYGLAVSYSVDDKLQLWLGRKINPNIANIGAIDGVQAQSSFGKFYAGIAAGSRPDFSDYSFNYHLFETGGYIGHKLKTEQGSMQSSLAFFEQMNHGKTDRRFIYFQHSNTLLKNVSLFASTELDLFKLSNGQPQSNLSLTGLYLSLGYRVSTKISLFTSFDERKNVIYYETFKTYADSVLQNVSRQGLRFRVNYRPLNYLNAGIEAGTRNSKNDSRPTKTLNGYTSFSRVPFINASTTLSANVIQTAYLDGKIYGARLFRNFFNGKLNTLASYSRVNFKYLNTGSRLLQNIGELNLSWQYNKNLYVSVNFEATFQQNEDYNRIYLNIRRSF